MNDHQTSKLIFLINIDQRPSNKLKHIKVCSTKPKPFGVSSQRVRSQYEGRNSTIAATNETTKPSPQQHELNRPGREAYNLSKQRQLKMGYEAILTDQNPVSENKR